MYLLALGAAAIASAFDLRCREIPNWISIGLLVCSLGILAMGRHPAGASQVFLGIAVAGAGSIALFAIGALGGGDVKLLTAIGAALGASAFFPFVLAMAVMGGVLALFARRRGERDLAYAPAMLLGLLALGLLVRFGQ